KSHRNEGHAPASQFSPKIQNFHIAPKPGPQASFVRQQMTHRVSEGNFICCRGKKANTTFSTRRRTVTLKKHVPLGIGIGIVPVEIEIGQIAVGVEIEGYTAYGRMSELSGLVLLRR